MSQWKRKLLDGASEVFTRGKKSKDKEEGQTKEAERASTLWIMARIDALDLKDPCSGSRRMVNYLARESISISSDRVRNLMRRKGLTCD